MIRVLSIIAAIAALAVSAAPLASAGTSKKPPSQTFIEIGTTETLDMNAKATPHSMFHGTGGNGAKFVRRGVAKAPRLTSISDGTSNTMMRSGSLKPPQDRILNMDMEI